MQSDTYILSAVAVMIAVTAFLRFVPFLLFKDKTPKVITYLGNVLPEAAIAMLVVYCFKGVTPLSGTHGLPELISTVVVVVLHKWKHNTLLSILGGTLLYMILVQFVFV